MSLKLHQLQNIVNETVKKRAIIDVLRETVQTETGFTIDASSSLDYACYQINDILDVAEARGDYAKLPLKTSTLNKLKESSSAEARKLAARTLPANLAASLRFDRDPSVRQTSCRQLSSELINEVVRRYPRDFEVQHILEAKKKEEAKLDVKSLDKAAKMNKQAEMSDLWYERHAKNFLEEYGTNIEYQWEEILIKRYCDSLKHTSKIEVDSDKMHKALMKLIKEKEDAALLADAERHVRKLKKEYGITEGATGNQAPGVENVTDTLRSIVNNQDRGSAFFSMANQILNVKEATLPASVRKYNVSEGVIRVPVKAKIPGGSLTALAEQAFDAYVAKWNSLQENRGEPLKLSWDPDQGDVAGVTFSVILR